jgi:hypothetical protein
VTGIDMDVALSLASARGCDLVVLSNCYRLPRRVWPRRSVAIEFGMTGLDQAPAMSADCPLAAISTHMRHFRL